MRLANFYLKKIEKEATAMAMLKEGTCVFSILLYQTQRDITQQQHKEECMVNHVRYPPVRSSHPILLLQIAQYLDKAVTAMKTSGRFRVLCDCALRARPFLPNGRAADHGLAMQFTQSFAQGRDQLGLCRLYGQGGG